MAKMLEEFQRRHAVSSLRKELYPLVQDWWWAREESLTVFGDHLNANNHCVIDGF